MIMDILSWCRMVRMISIPIFSLTEIVVTFMFFSIGISVVIWLLCSSVSLSLLILLSFLPLMLSCCSVSLMVRLLFVLFLLKSVLVLAIVFISGWLPLISLILLKKWAGSSQPMNNRSQHLLLEMRSAFRLTLPLEIDVTCL